MKNWIAVTVLALFLLGAQVFAQENPNILFILGDDMGVDAISGFDVGNNHPQTPELDKLREAGVTFTQVWAAPVCSATRASLLTGKYGINNGVNSVPGFLSTEHKSIFKEIKEQTNGLYKTCLIGKWHLSKRRDYNHPYEHGIDEFMGVMGAGVSDYYNWDKVENGKLEKCSTYATQYFTDYAIDWIKKQQTPWFMWLAHVAPHAPFQLPPDGTYSTSYTTSRKGKYQAMIESLDYEIGRLLKHIPPKVLKNTIVVFLGDNGTPGRFVSGFPIKRGKRTIYQGGICAPLIISGAGVTRQGEKENALVNISDFYATFSQLVQPNAFPTGQINDGFSFKALLSNAQAAPRHYNYMALGANRDITYSKYAVRNANYKLIDMGDGTFELYNLKEDPYEQKNLLDKTLDREQALAKHDLLEQMARIRKTELPQTNKANKPKRTAETTGQKGGYPIVHTGVTDFYDTHKKIDAPNRSNNLFWQDAGRIYNPPSYTDNKNGTVTDNITGLMWEKDMGEKMTYAQAQEKAKNATLGGYTDWRIPSIKELYSLIQFTGRVMGMNAQTPFIDTRYFNQPLGDETKGERPIDAQTWSSTPYTGKTMRGNETIFGVNFVDGRIKGYPTYKRRENKANQMYFRMVRGNTNYGKNRLVDNGDGTISDLATGLMWQKADAGKPLDWPSSIAYCENLKLGGHDDWHLPNIKELQSIVDYQRSPEASQSPAIDPVFEVSEIADPDNNPGHFPCYWATTVHLDGPRPYSNATYIAFGKSLGKMRGRLLDVHGAGSQRSDPKTGSPSDYPKFRGPQGDLVSVFNYCRAVRRIDTDKQ